MKKSIILIVLLCYCLNGITQDFSTGWDGNDLLPDSEFLNVSSWICNQSDVTRGDSGYVTSDSHTLGLHWRLGTGNRSKFVQCYLITDQPVDLSSIDIFGFDILGTKKNEHFRNLEFKFESGSHQTSYVWEDLAHMSRWCNQISLLKKQFPGHDQFRWDSVTVISLAVTSAASVSDTQTDTGTIYFRNLIGQSADQFIRADTSEILNLPAEQLNLIKSNAALALKNRQDNNTGLLVTWLPDGSSWLYGQGLALRILCEEGQWDNKVPANIFAEAAENLAEFLIEHQEQGGYWPRAWNAATGMPIVTVEANNTVWMGDFPWIPGSLAYYYLKSSDKRAIPVIASAKKFMYNLIESDGKVNTENILTHETSEVSNYEGHAAVLYFLMQLGDTAMVQKVMNYVMSSGWDDQLKYWQEGFSSNRPVLLVNTWIASVAKKLGYVANAIDALSFCGKILYTQGAREPFGFDGIGPFAVWYEGTLSYIAAGGPAGNSLFSGIIPYINTDGTVPAYNENLGGIAGIWAVDWSSLDATSWLYYAAAQSTPFNYSGAQPSLFPDTVISDIRTHESDELKIYVTGSRINISGNQPSDVLDLKVYSASGVLLGSQTLNNTGEVADISSITGGGVNEGNLYLILLSTADHRYTCKFIYRR